MLKAELIYPDGLGSYTTMPIANVLDIDIAEDSITGFSFWHVEGGKASITVPMFAELQAVLDQVVTNYYDAEIVIYEGTAPRNDIFLGYIKRGAYSYSDELEMSLSDSIVTLELHNPLKILVELSYDWEQSWGYLSIYSPNSLIYLIVTRLLEEVSDGTFIRTINYADTYIPYITNPTSVTGLTIFDSNYYPLASQAFNPHNTTTYLQRDIRQYHIETVGGIDYMYYYRNKIVCKYRAEPFTTSQTMWFIYSAIRKHKFIISGSSMSEVANEQWNVWNNESSLFTGTDLLTATNANGQTPEQWIALYDNINIIPPLETTSPSGLTFTLSGNQRNATVNNPVDLTIPLTVTYSGKAGYETVIITPKQVKSRDMLAGCLRANLGSLICKFDTIYLKNKVFDEFNADPVGNSVIGYPRVKSNSVVNDIVTPDELPFGVDPPSGAINNYAVTMANGINDYFKRVSRDQLPHEINLEIDLNPLSEELTQTLEVGKTYEFGMFYVYITGIKTDYEYRTARIKGLGKWHD